jgi:hypothetical protein
MSFKKCFHIVDGIDWIDTGIQNATVLTSKEPPRDLKRKEKSNPLKQRFTRAVDFVEGVAHIGDH